MDIFAFVGTLVAKVVGFLAGILVEAFILLLALGMAGIALLLTNDKMLAGVLTLVFWACFEGLVKWLLRKHRGSANARPALAVETPRTDGR